MLRDLIEALPPWYWLLVALLCLLSAVASVLELCIKHAQP